MHCRQNVIHFVLPLGFISWIVVKALTDGNVHKHAYLFLMMSAG